MRRFILLCLLFPLWLQAKELIIGGTLEPPLKYLDAQGVPHGLDVDVVSTIFGKLRIPIRIELTDSGARLTRNAETGVYDLVMTHSYKPERERYLLYPQQAHLRHSWHFFVRKADLLKIRYDTLADLKPWRIGITKDFSYTPELTAALADPAYHFQEIPINQLQLRKLIAGRIDVVPMPLVTAFAQIKEEGLEGKLDYLPKPHAGAFLRLLQRERLAPRQCILVEDTRANLATAKRLGMKTVWIAPGTRRAACTEVRVTRLLDLPAHLGRL